MAQGKDSRQKSRRTESPLKGNFILPPKTNSAVQIVAHSIKTSDLVPSQASQNNRAPTYTNGSRDWQQKGSLFIPPRKMGKPKYLDDSASKIIRPASEQAPGEDRLTTSVVPSCALSSQSPQSDGGFYAPQSNPTTESTLDIYASNYIPLWQTAINDLPATPRYCCPLSTIDYATYVNSFAGYRTLSSLPPITLPPIHKVPLRITSPAEDLVPKQYGEYFSDAFQNEIAAQLEELMSCSIYNTAFEFEDSSQQLYRFTIPGLREMSPRVDLGDIVKIRPLIPAPPQFLGRTRNSQLTPGFSGLEFYAIVWGISKPQEHIILRMDGFMPALLACNIIFTVQEHQCAPLWRSIDSTARSLSAADDAHRPWLWRMLFPDKQDARVQSTLSKGDFDLKWFDLQLNFEQQKAVDAVVKANYGCVPYLISGPPGTGKTKTIVETTLQLLQSESCGATPHLLVCAPSDSAADTLATRLCVHLDPSSLFRLNGWTRSFAEVPGNLLPYTNAENNLFSLPEFETMMKYKVVVTTCRDVDMLFQGRLTNEALIDIVKKPLSAIAPRASASIDPRQLIHWTALLLDEAAQATEPELLIPLSVVDPGPLFADAEALSKEWSHSIPQVVMAGDQHQLGPRLSLKSFSPLSTSLFTRLFARPLYSSHPLSRVNGSKPLTSAMLPMLRPTFTNLTRNYRSHPAILTVPSVTFYSDTLIAECTALTEVVRTWPCWLAGGRNLVVAHNDAVEGESPNTRPENFACWPILFMENAGPDALESILVGNGTGTGGLFNANEATIALNVVKSLLSHSIPSLPAERVQDGLAESGLSIQAEEIAVMSPFRAQVNYLRKKFREAGLYGVNIGPLEAFQGLESRIVIICTTRTRLGPEGQGRDRFVREDQARGFGVIGEPKKFNVAITRAKEGLIVVGSEACLTCTGDEAWMEFLAFCERTNGIARSSSKTVHQPLTSHMQRQGRLERALRYAGNLRRRQDEAEKGKVALTQKPATGFGYSSRPQPTKKGLKGNMPSLDEDMFREGLNMADEMRESADDDGALDGVGGYQEFSSRHEHNEAANTSVTHARHLPANNVPRELGEEESSSPIMPAVNGGSLTPLIRLPLKAVGAQNEILIDVTNTPGSTGRVSGSSVAVTPGRTKTAALSGMQFGSFKQPMPPSPEKSSVQNVDARGSDNGKGYDRDPEAEYERQERVDCATQ